MTMANKLGSQWLVPECIKLAIALLLALVAAWRFLFGGSKRRQLLPPGPFQWPILGNLHLLLGGLPHRVLAALSMKYGPLMSLRLGSSLTLVVSTADVAKEFLKTHDQFFASRPPTAAAEYLSYNYLDIVASLDGPSWRHLSKVFILQILSSRCIEDSQVKWRGYDCNLI